MVLKDVADCFTRGGILVWKRWQTGLTRCDRLVLEDVADWSCKKKRKVLVLHHVKDWPYKKMWQYGSCNKYGQWSCRNRNTITLEWNSVSGQGLYHEWVWCIWWRTEIGMCSCDCPCPCISLHECVQVRMGIKHACWTDMQPASLTNQPNVKNCNDALARVIDISPLHTQRKPLTLLWNQQQCCPSIGQQEILQIIGRCSFNEYLQWVGRVLCPNLISYPEEPRSATKPTTPIQSIESNPILLKFLSGQACSLQIS